MKVQQFVTSRNSFYSLTDEEANFLYSISFASDSISSSFALADSYTGDRAVVETFTSGIQFSVGAEIIKVRIEMLEHQLVFAESLYVRHNGLFSSTMGAGLSLAQQLVKLASIINSASFNNTLNTRAERIAQIALTMALMHSLDYSKKDTILSQIVYSADFKTKLTTYSRLVEHIMFNLDINQSILVMLSENIGFSSDLSSSAQLYSMLEHGLGLSLSFVVNLDGETYVSYAVNTKTSGLSEYTDTNFNSMHFPLGCKRDGIYRIDQAKDDSVIASMKTGITEFGSSLQKQVPYVYLGITNDEQLVLKATTTHQGIKTERFYDVISNNIVTDTTRAELGRGVKGRLWQFELSNIRDRVESFEVLHRILMRRV